MHGCRVATPCSCAPLHRRARPLLLRCDADRRTPPPHTHPLPCRPQGGAKLLQLGLQYPRLVRVRADWVAPEGKGKQRRGGWALKTKQERILM